MSLPFILDIAIGLIFIYLILSLLASEIQEFLSTVFQWRSKHLRDSIENLLAGSSNKNNDEINRVKKLTIQLYTHPLIDNINQEAKGFFVNIPRWFTWKLGDLYHGVGSLITRRKHSLQRNYFHSDFKNTRRSAPSYIPSETFATTLLETLEIPTLVHKFSESKLAQFKERILTETKDCLLEANIPGINENKFSIDETKIDKPGDPAPPLFKQRLKLENELNKIVGDFKDNKVTLETSVERIEKRVESYISNSKNQTYLTDEVRENFEKNLNDLKDNLLVEGNEREVLLRGMKPSLAEVVKAFKKDTPVNKEIIKLLEAEAEDKDACAKVKKLKKVIDQLPNSVRESISVLAHRAQSRVELTETDINQLRQEIELWFERSMERASGVYKRNAKGVAILIGFSIAIAINADTFHMVTRLSKDSSLRTAVTQRAGQVAEQSHTESLDKDLNEFTEKVDKALAGISLPIGWDAENIKQQKQESQGWLFGCDLDNTKQQKQDCQESPSTFYFFRKTPSLKAILGWIVTAIAISMGASFWFDLLDKLINVRNTGGKPAPSSTEFTTESRKSNALPPTQKTQDKRI